MADAQVPDRFKLRIAARLLGVSTMTLWRWNAAEKIRFERDPQNGRGDVYIARAEVEAILGRPITAEDYEAALLDVRHRIRREPRSDPFAPPGLAPYAKPAGPHEPVIVVYWTGAHEVSHALRCAFQRPVLLIEAADAGLAIGAALRARDAFNVPVIVSAPLLDVMLKDFVLSIADRACKAADLVHLLPHPAMPEAKRLEMAHALVAKVLNPIGASHSAVTPDPQPVVHDARRLGKPSHRDIVIG